MKRFLVLFFTACALFGQTEEEPVSQAEPCCPILFCEQPYLYIEAFGGANFIPSFEDDGVKTTFHTGYLFSGSLGCSFYYGLRVEGEYAYRRNSIKDIGFFGITFPIPGHYQSSSFMGNLIWEMPLDKWLCRSIGLKPMIGGGLGYDDQHITGDLGILSYSVIEKGFAWQVMAGVAYQLCRCLDISADYKCHKGRIDDLYCHSVGLALNYHFYSFDAQ